MITEKKQTHGAMLWHVNTFRQMEAFIDSLPFALEAGALNHLDVPDITRCYVEAGNNALAGCRDHGLTDYAEAIKRKVRSAEQALKDMDAAIAAYNADMA